MTKEGRYILIMIFFVAWVLVMARKCSVIRVIEREKLVPYKIERTDTLTLVDTVYLEGDTQYVQQKVDTAEILRDYLSKVYYSDTLVNDSNVFLVVNDIVFMNRIHDRTIEYNKRFIFVEPEIDRGGFVVGVGGTLRGIDASLGYRMNNSTYSLTYSANGIGIKYQYEINKKNRRQRD
jgi:hypothetical protein